MRTLSMGLYLGASQGKGGVFSAGQRATMAILKPAILAAASNNPDDNAEYSPAATVTVGNSADGTLTQIYPYTTNSDKITLAGGVPVQKAASSMWYVKCANASPAAGQLNGITGNTADNTWSNWLQVVEFETDAPTFQVRLDPTGQFSSATSHLPVRCIVDGKFISKTGHGGYYAPFYYKVAGLQTGVWERVRVESRGGLQQVSVPSGYTIRAVQTPSIKGAVEGDSYSEPQAIRYDGTILANGHVSWASNAVRKLGWGTARPVAVGLTGYVATGSGTRRAIPDRIADWATYETLRYVFVAAGFNDGNGDPPGIRAAAILSWQRIRAAQPSALIIVMGVFPLGAGQAAYEDNIKVAYDAWADPFSIFIPMARATPTPWTYTADTDNVHASNVGHVELGALTAPAVASAVGTLATTMGV